MITLDDFSRDILVPRIFEILIEHMEKRQDQIISCLCGEFGRVIDKDGLHG
jgi:hypothetical protein